MGGASIGKTGLGTARAGLFRGLVFALGVFAVSSGPGLAEQDIKRPGDVAAPNEVCGEKPLLIARMQWPSAIVLSYVHALILERELGCSTQVVAGDTAATISSMVTTGQPDIAPEVWVSRIAGIWNSGFEAARVHPMSPTFGPGALEGWYVPAHVVETFPELSGVDDLAPYADSLAAEGIRPRFISCPPDWACALINRNLLTALGLKERFEIIEPANRFEMDRLIAQSVSRRQPVVFYYWQPNAVLAQFDFKALDMGPFDAENFKCLARLGCAEPVFSAFVAEPVFLVAVDRIVTELPKVSQYLSQARMPIGEMNLILSWQAGGGASFEELAARFVRERQQVWRPWLEGL